MATRGGRFAGNMPGGFQRIPGHPAPSNDGEAYQARLDAQREVRAILSGFEGGARLALEAEVAEMRRKRVDPREILALLSSAKDEADKRRRSEGQGGS